MPKKPKIEHPLRKLRLITGKTQVEFARALACSPSTIKKIEEGDNSKLNTSLLPSLTNVFGVSHDSILSPSTQPMTFDGKPYTKEFFEDWWKNGAERMKFYTLEQKESMVRDFEMVLAAAMRVRGRGFGAIFTSYYDWLVGLMDDCQLWPHYEAELRERIKEAKSRPNNFQSDLELARLFRENRSKFLQEAFGFNFRVTTLMEDLQKKKNRNLKKELPIKPKKLSKLEKLKAQKYIVTYILRKTFQEAASINSRPKRTR